MRRVELIFNQAVEPDFLDLCQRKNVARHYTKLSGVFGKGNTSPKMGDSVWPQENVIYIVYCDDEEAAALTEIADTIREEYPADGVALFVM